MGDNSWRSTGPPQYTNGSGKCPLGAAHDVALIELGRRVANVESTQQKLDAEFIEIISTLRALTDKQETRKAQLTAGSAILIALIAALSTIGAQFISSVFAR
jgi:hypothetical protein